MNTKILMSATAIILGVSGVVLSFLPQEVSEYLTDSSPTAGETVVLQILGALYFAFAMINWTARANLIGGIYGRPIAIGNLTHFVIGALALVKGYFATNMTAFIIPAIFYSLGAILFSIIFLRHPVRE